MLNLRSSQAAAKFDDFSTSSDFSSCASSDSITCSLVECSLLSFLLTFSSSIIIDPAAEALLLPSIETTYSSGLVTFMPLPFKLPVCVAAPSSSTALWCAMYSKLAATISLLQPEHTFLLVAQGSHRALYALWIALLLQSRQLDGIFKGLYLLYLNLHCSFSLHLLQTPSHITR